MDTPVLPTPPAAARPAPAPVPAPVPAPAAAAEASAHQAAPSGDAAPWLAGSSASAAAGPRASGPVVLLGASAAAPDLHKFLPDSLIAATVPLAAGADALEVAYHAAAYALDTERLRVIYRAAKDQVHYLAAAASDFAALPPQRHFGTALAHALDHALTRRKDALPLAVLEADDGGTAAIVVHEGRLHAFRGYSALIEQQLKDRYGEIELLDATQLPATDDWRGYAQLQDASARRMQRASLWTAATLATLSLAGLVALRMSPGAGAQPLIAQANHELLAGASDAVRRANAPVLSASHTFFEVQRLATLATDSGGRIVKFVQDGRRIAWEVQLPAWVTQEMLTPLGSDIRVRRDGSMLVVRRGLLDREDEAALGAQRTDALLGAQRTDALLGAQRTDAQLGAQRTDAMPGALRTDADPAQQSAGTTAAPK